MPGIPELLIVLLIVFLIFGAGKLPGIGDALGRSIKNFKRSTKDDEQDEERKPEISAKRRDQLSGAANDAIDAKLAGKEPARAAAADKNDVD